MVIAQVKLSHTTYLFYNLLMVDIRIKSLPSANISKITLHMKYELKGLNLRLI